MLNGSVTPPPSTLPKGAWLCTHALRRSNHTHTYTQTSLALSHAPEKKQPKRAALFSWHATCQAIPPALHRRTPTPDWLKAQPGSCKPLSHRNPSLHSLTITEKKISEKKERKERRTQVRAKGITLHADSPYLVYLRLYPRLAPSGGSLLPRRRVAWLFMNISWASRPSEGKELLLRSSQSPPLAGFPRQPPQHQQQQPGEQTLLSSPPLPSALGCWAAPWLYQCLKCQWTPLPAEGHSLTEGMLGTAAKHLLECLL